MIILKLVLAFQLNLIAIPPESFQKVFRDYETSEESSDEDEEGEELAA